MFGKKKKTNEEIAMKEIEKMQKRIHKTTSELDSLTLSLMMTTNKMLVTK